MNCVAQTHGKILRDDEFGHNTYDRAFFAIAALLFFGCAAATIFMCVSMSAMSAMPMPGGWTMSMAWMRMPGQSWINAAIAFIGMWSMMMVAMMLPSLIPMLLRYRSALKKINTIRLGKLTASAGAGYFLAWTLVGIAIFPLGTALAAFEMQMSTLARMTPLITAIIVMLAGAFQFTTRKAHLLICCREAPKNIDVAPATIGTAWRYGLRLGARCIYCCANLTAILLVVGVMDVGAMAIATLAISVERLMSDSRGAARAVGMIIIVAGIIMLACAVGFY